MADGPTSFDVRTVDGRVSVIDIAGDVTPATEPVLMDAYGRAESAGAIVLNFSDMEYMNSGGIGLLVTLLVRAQRRRQRLLAYGLSDHYRQIFDLTRLNDVIAIHDDEPDAVAAAV